MKFSSAIFFVLLITLNCNKFLDDLLIINKTPIVVPCVGVEITGLKNKYNSCTYYESDIVEENCYLLTTCNRKLDKTCDWKITQSFANCLKKYQ